MNKTTYLCLMVLGIFFLSQIPVQATTLSSHATNNTIQRVRIDFTMPNGYVRHLLLGFTSNNAATDGVDYGYDAPNIDNYPDDLNWMIDDERYVIQGVGAFDNNKQYPLGMFLSNAGQVKITLNSIENFETAIDVYVYDAINNVSVPLHDMDFEAILSEGNYLDRFFIAFSDSTDPSNGDILSIDKNELQQTTITYLINTKELHVKSNQLIDKINVTNLLGKKISTYQQLNTNEIKIPMYSTKENYLIVSTQSQNSLIQKIIVMP